MTSSDKRQHLVDIAYERFKRDGFHAVGIDRLISDADVARMTLYRHFASKEELIIVVLEQRAARFRARLARLAESSGSARARIFALFDWYERWIERDDFHGCIFAHAIAEYGRPDSPVFQQAAAQKQELREHLAAILRMELQPGRADELALALLMLIEGATLLAQTGGAENAVAVARGVARTLLDAEGVGQ